MNIFRRLLDWISMDSPEKRKFRRAHKTIDLTCMNWPQAEIAMRAGLKVKMFTWGFEYVKYNEEFGYYQKCIKKVGDNEIFQDDWKPTNAEKIGNFWCIVKE